MINPALILFKSVSTLPVHPFNFHKLAITFNSHSHNLASYLFRKSVRSAVSSFRHHKGRAFFLITKTFFIIFSIFCNKRVIFFKNRVCGVLFLRPISYITAPHLIEKSPISARFPKKRAIISRQPPDLM
nr:MAG TPA: hypothetical protein [Caudoviricetes sp.]